MPPQAVKHRPAVGKETCHFCHKTFNVRGYGRHEKACKSRPELPLPLPTKDTTCPRDDGEYFLASTSITSNQEPMLRTKGHWGSVPLFEDNERYRNPDPESSGDGIEDGALQIYHPC